MRHTVKEKMNEFLKKIEAEVEARKRTGSLFSYCKVCDIATETAADNACKRCRRPKK